MPKPLVEFCNKPMIVHQIEVRGQPQQGSTTHLTAALWRGTPLNVDIL